MARTDGPDRGRGGRGRRHERHGLAGGRNARCRWNVRPGVWEVRARIERFVEPALLLALREGSAHGYDLADTLEDLNPDDRVDLGNLYRLLRSLEAEGVVSSVWRRDLPGRSKRTYELTKEGEALLDAWAEALERAEQNLAAFHERYQRARRDRKRR
jgi:PadR family transcriptional regulator